MGFEPRTIGLGGQGHTIELQCISRQMDDILCINLMKVWQKAAEPPETSLVHPSIQFMWANLSIYSLVQDILKVWHPKDL